VARFGRGERLERHAGRVGPDRQMKRMTEDLVEGCPGVGEVINQSCVARPGEQEQQGRAQQQTQTERSSSANKR
jgi:hypothetical protein